MVLGSQQGHNGGLRGFTEGAVEESTRLPDTPTEGHIVVALWARRGLHSNEAQEYLEQEKADLVWRRIEDH